MAFLVKYFNVSRILFKVRNSILLWPSCLMGFTRKAKWLQWDLTHPIWQEKSFQKIEIKIS